MGGDYMQSSVPSHYGQRITWKVHAVCFCMETLCLM